MDSEEEIEQAFHEWWNATDDGDANISVYIMPIVNRARAEALREAAVKAQEAFVDEQGGIGYARVRTDWLHAEANRIEQNSEGNET